MSLNQVQKQSGFTIVELLIVIVIIAILAAISIFGYNGFINRGKASAAQQLASQIAKKAESWNAVQGSYASYCNFARNETNTGGASSTPFTGTTGCTANASPAAGPQEAKLDNPSNIRSNAAVDETAVRYELCGSTGARISWAGGGQTGILTQGTGC